MQPLHPTEVRYDWTPKFTKNTDVLTFGICLDARLSMEVIVTSDRKLVYFTYLGDVSNLLI